MMSRLSENLRHSYASVGLRALCNTSYMRRPLDKFRQLRHLAVCDLYSIGPRLQRREPPVQIISRRSQQVAMTGRSTAPPTEYIASLQQLALQAAKTGAEVVQEALDKPRNIHFKGVTDLVTDTDRASEDAILKVLQKEVPDHGFLGEEGGVSGNTDSEYLWCIDPIDGTTNFAAGYPSFGVSVAVLHKAVPVAAAVVEFAGGPTAWVTRTYSASQGAGAQCNGKELKVTNTTDVTQSLLVTGFGYEHDEAWSANMELFKELTDVSRGVRRLGAAAVDLCHVALGGPSCLAASIINHMVFEHNFEKC
ncbi:TPA: Phosphatase impl1, chloroplastic, variant 3 [Trebouxia sp. C0004]